MEGTFVVEFLVDDDRAGRVQGDPRGLEPQPRRVGPSPGGDQDLVDFERFSVGEIYAQGWAGFADPHRQASKPKLDAGASHLLAQAVAHVFVESAQDIAGAHDLGDLGPEPPEQRGELDRDIAASHHEQPARKRSEVENLVRGDGVLQPFDERQELGPGAGRNQDVPRGDLTTVSEAHLMSADYFGPLFDRFDARVSQIRAIGLREAGDLLLLGGDELRPFETRLAHAPSKTLGVAKSVRETAGVDEQFLGHAAADDAGSADPGFLGDHCSRAMAGRDPGGAHAPGSRADDEQIHVEIHDASRSRSLAWSGRSRNCSRAR